MTHTQFTSKAAAVLENIKIIWFNEIVYSYIFLTLTQISYSKCETLPHHHHHFDDHTAKKLNIYSIWIMWTYMKLIRVKEYIGEREGKSRWIAYYFVQVCLINYDRHLI